MIKSTCGHHAVSTYTTEHLVFSLKKFAKQQEHSVPCLRSHASCDSCVLLRAPSQSPAYTLVWTRMGNGKLPNRAMDFNGILTIQNVQSEDAGAYVCTGSNMFAMDEGNAILYVPGS